MNVNRIHRITFPVSVQAGAGLPQPHVLTIEVPATSHGEAADIVTEALDWYVANRERIQEARDESHEHLRGDF